MQSPGWSYILCMVWCLIWWFCREMSMVVHDTECPYRAQVSLNDTNPTPKHCRIQLDDISNTHTYAISWPISIKWSFWWVRINLLKQFCESSLENWLKKVVFMTINYEMIVESFFMVTACKGKATFVVVFLYCCQDCPGCLAHLESLDWAIWAIIKKYSSVLPCSVFMFWFYRCLLVRSQKSLSM